MSVPLLEIHNLAIITTNQTSELSLIKGINLKVARGEIVGLIGESGSGKSLTAKAILGLLPECVKVSEGSIMFKETNVLTQSKKQRYSLLGRQMAIISQDYRGSFTPYIKIGKQMMETIRSHSSLSKKEAKQIAFDMLSHMDLPEERIYNSYPFQLSGGQVQRAAVATIMALQPSFIICDEVTTALDVINGEKVMNYIDMIRKKTNCGVLMITHDLTQAFKRTDRLYVMSQGEIVEEGPTKKIRRLPTHAYTKSLYASLLPLPDKQKETSARRVVDL
ncbi:ATP-binding cassette domain-containing protein [Alkalihalophilus sp. As8PL]|uniref:ATP-binding cassette domain-containing protein n=1 Tax=Alkalihalophilus sp. As8PL TaxID=3237103 RepID=A0AB39BW63_9BACI